MKNHRDYIQECIEDNRVDELIAHMDNYVNSNSSMVEFEARSFYKYYFLELKMELKRCKNLKELNEMPYFKIWQEYGFTNYIDRSMVLNNK